MSYFDSPLGRCEVVHAMVLVDQTQAECALEHDCPFGCTCALAACFSAVNPVPSNVHATGRAVLTAS